jgi:hypothetical protein
VVVRLDEVLNITLSLKMLFERPGIASLVDLGRTANAALISEHGFDIEHPLATMSSD